MTISVIRIRPGLLCIYDKFPNHLFWLNSAAGIFYKTEILLSSAAEAVLMSVSTVVVAINASLLKVKIS